MFGKRAPVLTLNHLTALSKVCSSRRFPPPVTHFNAFLSTAPQRWDSHSPDSTSQFENSIYDTPSSLGHEQKQYEQALNSNRGSEVCHVNDYTGSSFGENRNSYNNGLQLKGNHMGAAGQTGNFSWRRNHNGNVGTSPNGTYDNGSWRGAEQGFHQNHDGMHWENKRNELQNNAVCKNGNFKGYGYEANAHSTTSMQNQGGSYWERPTGTRQNQNDINLQRFPEPQGSRDENNPHNWQFQQSQRDFQGPNFSQRWQNPQDISNFNSHGKVTSNGNYHGQVTNIVHSYGQVSATSKEQSTEVPKTCSNDATVEMLEEFCNEGNVKEAIRILGLMKQRGVHVDLAQMLQLMKACGEVKALQEAKTVHEHLLGSFSPLEISIYDRILEMYLKCGSADDAFDVFDKMPRHTLTSWDTMITWLARNGLGEDALDLFYRFKQAGLEPNAEMFIGVFYSCGIVGDVNEGMCHFSSMSREYGIVPSMEHYVSVVDMLGSVGHLDEALEFIEKMPFEPSVDVWETLMNLCRVHGHLELGDRCAELVKLLDPSRLNEQSKTGLLPLKDSDVKQKEKKQLSTQSPLEVRSRVREYRAGDTSHPENDRIYTLLRNLKEHMKEIGYVPETRFVLHDIDQESKEEALLAHSERLALANGLLTSPARGPIRIIKNLRVCGDCHTAFKFMSKIIGRMIIMRDAKRFHHFKDGLCSCKDFW